MRKLTVSEYAKEFGVSDDTVLYRLKKNKLSGEQNKKTKRWIIHLNDEERGNSIQEKFKELEKLKIELVKTKTELQIKNDFIEKLESKNQKIIDSKDETIESQKKTIKTLEEQYESIKSQLSKKNNNSSTNNLLATDIKKTLKTKIELMEYLKNKGFDDYKTRKRIRERFNRKLDKDKRIIKTQEGKIYIEKNENYEKFFVV